MQVMQIRTLEGPNVWSKRRMLEAVVTIEPHDKTLLLECLSRLIEACSDTELLLLPSEIPSLTWPPIPTDELDIVVTLMLNLQRRVQLNVREFAIQRALGHSGVSTLAVQIDEDIVGRAAWQLACDAWRAVRTGSPFDLTSQFKQFNELAFDCCVGQTTRALMQAAQARGIPVHRLDHESLVQLGHGSRQRRLQTAVSDHSGYIAESVSRDKLLTKALLKRVGLPVPDGRTVHDADDAWAAVCELACPVVVKPRDADYGQGVSLKLSTRLETDAAYAAARKYSDEVIVERFLEGAHHRLMVVGNEVVAAVRFERAVVVGDGQRTVAELIEEMNCDPRRGARDDKTCPWFWMEIDDETRRVLALQESGLDHRPAAGERITLRLEPRIGWGGGVFDVTDDVHPDVSATVIDAVSMVGLDIAGVDLIATDISRPLAEQHGGLLEVNAGPAILMHLQPFSDPPRPVPEAIVSFLFARPQGARIPLISFCGHDESSDVATLLTSLLRHQSSQVGLATRDGVFVNDRCLLRRSGADVRGAQMLLLNPRVEAAVIEVSLEKIEEEGLGFDQCQIAVVLGKRASAVQADDPDCSASHAAALNVLLETAQPAGTIVINLDDPNVMAHRFSFGPGMIGISLRHDHPSIEHLSQQGGRTVYLRNGTVTLGTDSNEFPLLPMRRINRPHELPPQFMKDIVAMIAVGWALGIPLERLRREFTDAMSHSRDVPQLASRAG